MIPGFAQNHQKVGRRKDTWLLTRTSGRCGDMYSSGLLGGILYYKALSLSTRASPLRVLEFLRRSALRRWSRSVSRPYKDSYDSSARPMGVASLNSTLPCAIATFPVALPLSSPGNV